MRNDRYILLLLRLGLLNLVLIAVPTRAQTEKQATE